MSSGSSLASNAVPLDCCDPLLAGALVLATVVAAGWAGLREMFAPSEASRAACKRWAVIATVVAVACYAAGVAPKLPVAAVAIAALDCWLICAVRAISRLPRATALRR